MKRVFILLTTCSLLACQNAVLAEESAKTTEFETPKEDILGSLRMKCDEARNCILPALKYEKPNARKEKYHPKARVGLKKPSDEPTTDSTAD